MLFPDNDTFTSEIHYKYFMTFTHGIYLNITFQCIALSRKNSNTNTDLCLSYLKILKHEKWSQISCTALPKLLLLFALPTRQQQETGTKSNCNRQIFPLHYLILMHQVSTHTGTPSFSISKRKQLPKVKKAICLSLNINKNKPEP